MTEQETTTHPAPEADSAVPEPLSEKLEAAASRNEGILASVTWPARRAGWAVQRRILWPTADALRRLADIVTWPFSRVAWLVRTRVAWPVQDELSLHGRGFQAMLVTGGTAFVAAAVAGGILLSGTGTGNAASEGRPVLASSSPVAVRDLAPPPSLGRSEAISTAPVLHGVDPDFKLLAKSDDSLAASGSGSSGDGDVTSTDAPDSVDTPPGTDDDTLAAKENIPSPGKVKPALDVSRQFADAFVKYEIGKSDADVREVFKRTAADPLVRALRKRPPRLPKGVKVPKARVLNVVPGPKRGGSLAVSVALVRLGASSELRLQLRHEEKTGWLVSDVRG